MFWFQIAESLRMAFIMLSQFESTFFWIFIEPVFHLFSSLSFRPSLEWWPVRYGALSCRNCDTNVYANNYCYYHFQSHYYYYYYNYYYYLSPLSQYLLVSFRSSAGCMPCTWGIRHTSHLFWSYIKHLPEVSCRSQHADLIIIIIIIIVQKVLLASPLRA